ncbi:MULTISPECIES: ParB/RepB/Spo0J family partition protein [Aeromonas]|jgi:ParB family chromosome partitioning protein|uniref:Probable chromosome-partitioning protein ParB n=5 Tax=Aeromonas TaxID=642 RepID=A0A0T6UA10_AERVE|nr:MULTISPECIES: ParB/RepB/Spo0J family partition protein [Aeromonas]MCR6550777.1 ParB/RepB/Spo0J family partition protein [Aeromonas sp. CPF2-S1]HDN9003010.1 ParB/RepB/Spo0J family partition protein [Aeromonas veronii AMC24]HDT6077008.1 ParB/RepB/Spo0J family partition protein [Aeromonas veronii bv. veronii]AMQ40986.1 chromosome partitioning protein ParB [Aeromonas veronii]ANB53427.1 chromosome partitioning protein ParB [Aeromonas veronii]
MTPKKRGLGKGLDALLSTSTAARQKQVMSDQRTEEAMAPTNQGELRKLPVEWLQSGKYQPRKDMSQDALEELANSIRAQGVIQPIVVRPLGEQSFEIIAGERRWRASQLARLEVVPCIVKDVPDEAAVAIALIENIQREDLNAIEEAVALQRLLTEFELTHQQVAEAVGKSRTTVTNLLRLNQLNDDVKRFVEHGDLDMGHARALLALSGQAQSELAKLVAQKGLTVRDTEKLVQKALEPAKARVEPARDPQIGYLERQLAEKIGNQVQLQPGKRDSGKLVISYENLSDLDRILGYFGVSES